MSLHCNNRVTPRLGCRGVLAGSPESVSWAGAAPTPIWLQGERIGHASSAALDCLRLGLHRLRQLGRLPNNVCHGRAGRHFGIAGHEAPVHAGYRTASEGQALARQLEQYGSVGRDYPKDLLFHIMKYTPKLNASQGVYLSNSVAVKGTLGHTLTGTMGSQHGSVDVPSAHGIGTMDEPLRHHEIGIGMRLLFDPAGYIVAGASCLGAKVMIEANHFNLASLEHGNRLSSSERPGIVVARRDSKIVKIEAHISLGVVLRQSNGT